MPNWSTDSGRGGYYRLDIPPYWQIAVYMTLMGGGSGLFGSPNVNALMSTVPPSQRSIASGVRVQ